jgi:RecJ-like exonuclease
MALDFNFLFAYIFIRKERRMDEHKAITIDKIKVKPTHLGQTCPVCNGFGTLRNGTKTCQGCGGKGYILIPAEEVHERK